LYGFRAVFDSANPAPQAGKYTFVLPGTRGATDSPAGDGYATASIDADGVVRLKGDLADGAHLSQRATLSRNGDWPFYESLYSGQGVVLGWLRFVDDGTNDVSGRVHWIRPPISNSLRYPAGFAVNSDVIGSRFTSPVGNQSILEFTDGLLILNGGNLPDSSNPVTFGPNGKLVNNGPNKLNLIFNRSSGEFQGAFKEAGSTQIFPLEGAVLQRQNIGSGHSIGTNQSGWILLRAVP
jgi:hypothetical protein